MQNRLPTIALKGTTPIEAWSGAKPSVSHMKVFDSCCYIHIPTIKRSKLDPKSEVGIFSGYASQSKGYRTYNIKEQKVVISRNIVVDENFFWNWSKQQVEKYFEIKELETIDVGIITSSPSSSNLESDVDDEPLKKKMKSRAKMYEKCNFTSAEPTSYKEATKEEG